MGSASSPLPKLGGLGEQRVSARVYGLPNGFPGIGRKRVLRAQAWAQMRGPMSSTRIPRQPHNPIPASVPRDTSILLIQGFPDTTLGVEHVRHSTGHIMGQMGSP